MSGISLTASMRSNLLSLQNIARQQDIVQNRLATGLKVSSAIDNPSSYYTASSLNNRAADLTALLDAMSQGIQTIKAASEAIDSGTKFLEQAKAVANQALETAENVVAKVSTAEELQEAVASGQEGLIVVENDIDMSTQNIVLADGQSLVGKSYFSSTEPAVQIKAKNIYAGENSVIANLAIETSYLFINNKQNVTLADLDLNLANSINSTNSEVTVSGHINAIATSNLFWMSASTLTFANGAILNSDSTGRTIVLNDHSQGFISQNVIINAKTYSSGMETISLNHSSRLDIAGTINAYGTTAGFAWLTNNGSNQLNILKTAQIYAELEKNNFNFIPANPGQTVFFEAGAQIGLKQAGTTTYIKCSENYTHDGTVDDMQSLLAQPDKFTTAAGGYSYDFTDFKDRVNSLIANRSASQNTDDEEKEIFTALFNKTIAQYDFLVADASYKGVNLLSGQNLKINFNEDRSSKIEIAGVKADSESLGLKTKKWYQPEDIEKSISELENAINSLRGFASEFGNYYSIVTTRQDFTENLINVLEEGADKLTLADMNQESANMLALQTAQQLAVNSLSLASQAAQAVLRLF